MCVESHSCSDVSPESIIHIGERSGGPCDLRLGGGRSGVFAVERPTDGVGRDAVADAVQGIVVADDVFEIGALPDGANHAVFPHDFRHADFETAHDGTDGF